VKLFAVRDIVVYAVVAGIAAGALSAAVAWARQRGRFLVVAASTTAGFIAWNLTLNATHAVDFNVDAPVIGLSWADAGSGVIAFVFTVAVLGLLERQETAGRVVGIAALAGVAAMVVDLFVL